MSKLEKILAKGENIFLRYGFKSVTMDHIARELGISKKTLYQFVDNKSDLIIKVIRLHITQEKKMIQEVKKNAKNALAEMLDISNNVNKSIKKVNSNLIFDLQKYYRDAWDIIETHRLEYVYTVIKENVERGINEGVYRSELHPDVVAKIYIGIMHLLLDPSYFPSEEYNSSKIYLESIHYHINGIASPKGMELLEKYYNERQKEQQ